MPFLDRFPELTATFILSCLRYLLQNSVGVPLKLRTARETHLRSQDAKGISIEPPTQNLLSVLLPSTTTREWNP
jgi:hypothetical protein